MDVVHERCCGLDVHKGTVVVCLMTPQGKQVKTFRTTTEQLRQLVQWMQAEDCWHAAMESTGVYWKPIYNILELSGIEAIVVNARHMKALPGRKTDVRDAEWICDLFRHGLVRGSFVPERPQRELQELVRFRTALIRERTREVNRIQKVLEGANIKLKGTAVSDVLGLSGRAMLQAMIDGETDPDAISARVRTKLKASPEDIRAAVDGLMGAHQRFMLKAQLEHVDSLNRQIAELDEEIARRTRPFQEQMVKLDAIPGIGRVGAQAVIASIGVDMSKFPTARHLASWAKLCPGMNESAGHRGSTSTGRCKMYLRSILIEAAWASIRAKPNYYRSQYYHLRSRLGPNKAIVAVAHSMLMTIYSILDTGNPYDDLGSNYFDERRTEAAIRQAVRRIERLGMRVTVEPAA
jgi:transposase